MSKPDVRESDKKAEAILREEWRLEPLIHPEPSIAETIARIMAPQRKAVEELVKAMRLMQGCLESRHDHTPFSAECETCIVLKAATTAIIRVEEAIK